MSFKVSFTCMKISMVIFDMDGTVVDDEAQYRSAFKTVAEKLGAKPDESFQLQGGVGVEKEWPLIISKYQIKTDKNIHELGVLTQQEYLSHINEVKLREGFLGLASALKEKEIKTALATSNNWSIVDVILKKFDLENFFDVVTTAEEVRELKPDPEIFSLTAAKEDIDPNQCVVVEDAASGIRAAHEAGMKVVAIADEKRGDAQLGDADMVVWSYNEITLKELENLK